MKYTDKKFTLPAAPPRVTDKAWDRIFLSEEEFKAKHNTEHVGKSITTCSDTKAPTGWSCTRVIGHDGPCAAIPYRYPKAIDE